MPRALKVWPLLTGSIRYEKTISTRNRGHGEFIDAPILAYLVETSNGRILYDVGCDYRKVADSALRARYFDPMRPQVEPPDMGEGQRIPSYLAQLGLAPSDIDLVFIGHLHFDHAGGLCDLRAATCMFRLMNWLRRVPDWMAVCLRMNWRMRINGG